jgi:heme-degrading monooxygenase HmoA
LHPHRQRPEPPWQHALLVNARSCGRLLLNAGGPPRRSGLWAYNLSTYEQHYRSEVLATLRQVPGFRGARLLRRTLGEETEFVSLTLFDNLHAIRSFAGPDYETAVVAGEARKVLIRFDERVCHDETTFEA